MAYGNELILGFNSAKWPIAEKSLKFKMPKIAAADDVESADDDVFADIAAAAIESVAQVVDKKLFKAWKRACAAMGWKDLGTWGKPPVSGIKWQTPVGPREIIPWTFEFQLDQDEMGEKPSDAIIGVPVSGRYWPTFVDWRNQHGTVWNLVVGPKEPIEMGIARSYIIEAVPAFADADWIIRERHY
jgi:hypothetical protein